MFEKDSRVIKAEIIVIGNEVTSGLIAETNARTISLRLNAEGIDVLRFTCIGDDEEGIADAVKEAFERVDMIVMTGGLGPTHDDITKKTLARMFDSGLIQDQRVAAMIEEFFRKRGRKMPEYSLGQSYVPHNADILYNEKGTAPGFLFHQNHKKLYVLPGVPLEMEHLLEKYIVPQAASMGKMKIGHRLLKTTGITESKLWDQAGSMESIQESVTVASLPSHLGVTIRISAVDQDSKVISQNLEQAESFFRERLGDFIYGKDKEVLETVVGQWLSKKQLKLAVADSCTGGLIGNRITNVSGSSDYFLEGFVTYSNEAKAKRLGVDAGMIERYGAVSKEAAIGMAEGARRITGADVTLAVTGIAGPAGGTKEKPVGLTYIALSAEWTCDCEMFLFPQDRIRNKERAAQAALNMLRLWLQNKQ